MGANDLFAALTEPDRAAEIEGLRAIRQALDRAPDDRTLATLRSQLDAILQKEEHRPGTMPPALVMSGIANRIEAAIAGLEAARHEAAQSPPPPTVSPAWFKSTWLVPSLAAATGTLILALAAALMALAGRTAGADDQDALVEAVGKIKRQIEVLATGVGEVQSRSTAASEDAAAAARESAHAVARLNSASKEAETRLLTCIDAAESRLHNALSFGSQVDAWAAALPSRLAEAVGAMEAGGLQRIEAAAQRLSESVGPLDALKGEVGELHQRIAQGAQALEANSAAAGAVAALRSQIDHLSSTLPQSLADACQAIAARTLGAIENAALDLAGSADTRAEVAELSAGLSAKLEDVIARADSFGQGMQKLGNHSLQVIDTASTQLAERTGTLAAAVARAEALALTLVQTLPGQVNDLSAVSASLGAGRAAMEEAVSAMAGVTAEAAAGSTRLAEAIAACALPAQTAALVQAAQGLHGEGAAFAAAARAQLHSEAELAGRFESTAGEMSAASSRIIGTLESSAAARAVADSAAEQHRAAQAEQLAATIEGVCARAEATLDTVAGQASALAAAAADIRAGAAAVSQAAQEIGGSASGQATALSAATESMLGTLRAACIRLEDVAAGLGGAGSSLRQDAALIRDEALAQGRQKAA